MKHSFGVAIIATVLLVVASFSMSGSYYLGLQMASAQDDWRKEFDDICGKTGDSLSLSDEELKALIERSDKLKPLIEKLDESDRKVFLRRLQKCRDLFSFVLSSRKKE
jgi:hypothetical protein